MFSPGRRIRNRSNFSARNASRPRYSPYAYEEWIILTDSDSDDGPPAPVVDIEEEEEVYAQPTSEEEEEEYPELDITDIASPRTEGKVSPKKTLNLELALVVDVVSEKKGDAVTKYSEKEDCESDKSANSSKGEECIPVAPIGQNEEQVEQQTKDFLIGWG